MGEGLNVESAQAPLIGDAKHRAISANFLSYDVYVILTRRSLRKRYLLVVPAFERSTFSASAFNVQCRMLSSWDLPVLEEA